MGYKRSLICNYDTLTSGGPDRGFRTSTNTYGLDCKSINDLVIEEGEFRLISKGGPKPDKIREDQECYDCGGKRFELWDEKKGHAQNANQK